jgi:adenosylcobinamide-GDP ribazoletransferase
MDQRNHVSALWFQTMRSVGFLSRISVPARYFEDNDPDEGMRENAAGFAVSGVLIAAAPALALIVLSAIGMPSFLAAMFCILSLAAITGGLHEDGLGDVADGFGGGSTVETRLEIMQDSRIGTYAAIAIAGSLFLRAGALAAILDNAGPFSAGLSLIAAAACSRAAIVWFWRALPNARPGGVAAGAGVPGDRAFNAAAITGLAIFLLLGLFAAGFANTTLALLIAAAGMAGFSILCRRMIGGHTGDTLGACQQIVEILLLAGLALGAATPN